MSSNNNPNDQGLSSPESESSGELRVPNRSNQPSPDVSIALPGTLTPSSTMERRSSSHLGDTYRRIRLASITPSPFPTPVNDESTLIYTNEGNSDAENLDSQYSSSDSDDNAPNRRADHHRSIRLAKREHKRRVLVRHKTHESFRLTSSKLINCVAINFNSLLFCMAIHVFT